MLSCLTVLARSTRHQCTIARSQSLVNLAPGCKGELCLGFGNYMKRKQRGKICCLGCIQKAQPLVSLRHRSHQNCTAWQTVHGNTTACLMAACWFSLPVAVLSVQRGARPRLCLCTRGHCCWPQESPQRRPAAGSETGSLRESLE